MDPTLVYVHENLRIGNVFILAAYWKGTRGNNNDATWLLNLPGRLNLPRAHALCACKSNPFNLSPDCAVIMSSLTSPANGRIISYPLFIRPFHPFIHFDPVISSLYPYFYLALSSFYPLFIRPHHLFIHFLSCPIIFLSIFSSGPTIFWDASSQLYKRSCPFVGP